MKMLSATRLMRLQLNKKRKQGLVDPVTVLPALRGGKTLQPRLALVKANAVIYAQPGASTAKLVEYQNSTQLEICDLRAGDWHCVLVPGFGFGWVHDRDVGKIIWWTIKPQGGSHEAESTLSSPLTSLVLNGECLYPLRVQQLLGVVGKSLESLDVKIGRMYSDILWYIADLCPSLKNLAIKSKMLKLKGSALRAFFAESSFYNLRSLTLNWGICNPRVLLEILAMPSQYSVASGLEELHLCYVRGDEFLDRLLEFDVMLTNNTVLEKLFLSGNESFEDWNLLRFFNGQIIAVNKSLRARLGFLSVAVTAKSSVVSLLSVDLMRIIFQFAVVKRVVGAWPPSKDEA